MIARHPIARTDNTVTLRRADSDTLISAAEAAEDIVALFAAGAREDALGKVEARADHLRVELVTRLVSGEHPVRLWREHRGVSSSALAKSAGVSRSYLAEIEGGKKPGSVAAYRGLAATLGIAIDDLTP